MAKIDINKLAKMITEDPDIFLEYEGYSMSNTEPGQVAGNKNGRRQRARQAVHEFGIKIRQAERMGNQQAVEQYRNELRKILEDLKYEWLNDPIASELLDD